ncbi:MAG: hypothetical protein IPM71_02280 [Bacteroidota bacterium]|nr:MAG: hypothetical protein IPM71_02280 [Bacteroidota bacterium]
MCKFLNFFDYVFYRTYSFLQKRNDDISDEKATNLVAVLQGFIIIDIIMILRFIFEFEFPMQNYNKWLWSLPLLLVVGILNHLRYKSSLKNDNYKIFHDLWKNEEPGIKNRNAWLIMLYIFLTIVGIPLLYVIFT